MHDLCTITICLWCLTDYYVDKFILFFCQLEHNSGSSCWWLWGHPYPGVLSMISDCSGYEEEEGTVFTSEVQIYVIIKRSLKLIVYWVIRANMALKYNWSPWLLFCKKHILMFHFMLMPWPWNVEIWKALHFWGGWVECGLWDPLLKKYSCVEPS